MNFTWAGQACGSTSRVVLHASIHDRVLDSVKQLIAQRHTPGIPTDWATTMGPLVSRAQYDKVMGYIQSARDEGARLVTGGKRPADPKLAKGFFIEPTVFANVTPAMRIAREEIFGPVLAVFKWTDEDELFRQVNAVDYGLTAGVFSEDDAEVERFLDEIEAGVVYVNRRAGATTGAWPGFQSFCGWKSSGSSGKGGLGPYYVQQFMREQSRTVVRA